MPTSRPFARRRGQVLIFLVMIMLILTVIIFFLFDLHNVIRLRGKTQDGADAAALTAAAWQGRSLNTIGELNLIKAATVLLTEIPPVAPDGSGLVSRDELLASAAAVSEMQARLTYVGPLLGLAAAQQSARNNQLRSVGYYTSDMEYHRRTWIDPVDGLYVGIYGTDPGGFLPTFNWLTTYDSLVADVLGRGLTARPVNSRYLLGAPNLNGVGGSLLADPDFYRAVYSSNYCWFYRRGLGPDAPPIDLDGISYSLNPEAWFLGSEYLPLYVELASGPQYDRGVMSDELDARGLLPIRPDQPGLPELTWAVYDLTGDGYGWSETGLYTFINPYLRSNVRREFTYSGAAARMTTTAAPSLITGRWTWQHGQQEGAERPTSLGEELAWSNIRYAGGSFAEHARRLREAEARIEQLRNNDTVNSVSAAKPFGEIYGEPPHSVGIVLPVFNQVRLIPVGLVRNNPVDAEPFFYRFLYEYFGHPDYPNVPEDIVNRYSYYLNAIARYNDLQSRFRVTWWDFDEWRNNYMAGPDGELGTDDDRRDPCQPVFPPGGGGPSGSRGGPGIIH